MSVWTRALVGLFVLLAARTAAADYVGCFTDDGNRALPAFQGGGYSLQACNDQCRNAGYAYSGSQYYDECYCGNSVGYSQVGDGECDTPCNSGGGYCGGGWRNSIYTTGASSGGGGQSGGGGGGPSGYVGCFTDDGNRALPAYLGEGFSLQACVDSCRSSGYAYSGSQYYDECFCGSSVGYSQVGDGECSTPCNSGGGYCGGAWRNSIYATGYVPPPPTCGGTNYGDCGSSGTCACNSVVYHPGRYVNAASGDIIVQSNPSSFVYSVVQAAGESATHVQAISDDTGLRVTQAIMDVAHVQDTHEACHLDPNTLRNAPPGVENNVIADSATGLWSLSGGDVLPAAANPGCSAGAEWYHIHGFADAMLNSQCAQVLHDSCGASYAGPRYYDQNTVYNSAVSVFNAAYQACRDQGINWFFNGVCGSSDSTICAGVGYQIVSEMLWDWAENHDGDWQYYWSAGLARDVYGPVSPQQLEWEYLSSGRGTPYAAQVQPGYWECVDYSCQ